MSEIVVDMGEETLFDSLQRASDDVAGDKRALAGLRDAHQWVELTYSELMSDIVTVSTHLRALGLEKGDVLCLQLPNWTEAVIYTYAASRLGAIVCPITTIYRRRELTFILERTECKIVVVPSVYRGFDYAAMMRDVADQVPGLKEIICVGDTETAGVRSSSSFLGTRWTHLPRSLRSPPTRSPFSPSPPGPPASPKA